MISVQVNPIVGIVFTLTAMRALTRNPQTSFRPFSFFSKNKIDDMKQNYSVVYRETEKQNKKKIDGKKAADKHGQSSDRYPINNNTANATAQFVRSC